MSGFYRDALNAILLSIVAALAVPLNTVAADLCTGLPASKLQVFDAKAPGVEEQKVSAKELDQIIPPEVIAARHATMLSMSNVAAFLEIRHRTVLREDGSVCDAPELVRIGFDSSRRRAFLTHQAADDKCVRQEMLNHEAVHAHAFNNTVGKFIDEQRAGFVRGMAALKQTPAPTVEIAMARRNAGLQLIAARRSNN